MIFSELFEWNYKSDRYYVENIFLIFNDLFTVLYIM